MNKLKGLLKPKWIILTLIMILGFVYFSINTQLKENVSIDYESLNSIATNDALYQNVIADWNLSSNQKIVLDADAMSASAIDGDTYGLDERVVLFENDTTISLNLTAPEAGAYQIALNQMDIGESILNHRIAVKINGEFQYEEAQSIDLYTDWVFSTDEFPLDRYGNEILPNSIKNPSLKMTYLFDTTGLNSDPLLFNLRSGLNTIELIHVRGSFVVSDLTVESPKEPLSYEDYLQLHNSHDLKVNETLTIGAESFISKSSPSTRLTSERDPSATNYDTRYQRLNAIDGYSFRHGNNTITYEVTVSESGFYHLGFKYRQNYLQQMPVFREIQINGEVPFDEMRMVPFHYTTTYDSMLLNDGIDPYMFYLEEGTNTISMRVVLDPYRVAYHNVTTIMSEITDLSLEIKKLTGNTVDRYRNWDLEDYIPDIEARLDRWISSLEETEAVLRDYSFHKEPGELTNIIVAIDQLNRLKDDIDDIPNNMMLLADGDASTAQLLGATAQVFLENGLDLEAITLTGSDKLPPARANVFTRMYEGVRRFFLSFTTSDYAVDEVDEETIEIWVNYPRQYVEIMQQIIDANFTAETGIPVKLSVMPDENKLILANSADMAPDIALGVNHWIPYEFAIRGASLDLRQFDGYEEVVSNFSKGVMIPYVFEDGVYGMPLTQNFWVTFYRTDILDSLDIPVPDTWEEVIEILPEMQRYGLNYFEPISQFRGFKPFVVTIPFIYQYGGELYTEDGMATTINSEANIEGIEMMTELFTIYNVPKEVPSFYNQFRNGQLPIGIGDLATYLQLTIAAPEIAGKWEIAPHPGVKLDSGEVVRYAASGAQSSMIMASTDKPDASWDFLQWWMSTEVQVDFAIRLQTTYGTEFLWNTANLEAFAQLPLPQEHIDVILTQWEYAMEASRIPGAYMVERELSNAWNRIVFEDANPRVTLDNAVKIANREILYRMEEFGYVSNNEVIKPYTVPTIYNIDQWLKEHDND
ncbi:MAG: extracellular solute-binding protein [Candidatus Izemoplasmataceae bacterium]